MHRLNQLYTVTLTEPEVRGDASPKSANSHTGATFCTQYMLPKTRYLKTWVCLCSKIHEQKYKFGVNRPIPEVNWYDCMEKSLIEVRHDRYDLLVSLPKYVQQIRSFCSTPPPYNAGKKPSPFGSPTKE